jgi:hypothetical protein
MATKKTTKSRVSKTAKNKKGGFKFRWWMAVILVMIVAVVGIVVVRFSHAMGQYGYGPSFSGQQPILVFDVTSNWCEANGNCIGAINGGFFGNYGFRPQIRRVNHATSGAYIWQFQSGGNANCGVLSKSATNSKFGKVPTEVIGTGPGMQSFFTRLDHAFWTGTTCW